MRILLAYLHPILSRKNILVPGTMVTPLTDGTIEFAVDWHFCADYKLLALCMGHGGSACKNMCIFCPNCKGCLDECEDRTDDSMAPLAVWARSYLAPLLIAQNKVRFFQWVLIKFALSRLHVHCL